MTKQSGRGLAAEEEAAITSTTDAKGQSWLGQQHGKAEPPWDSRRLFATKQNLFTRIISFNPQPPWRKILVLSLTTDKEPNALRGV